MSKKEKNRSGGDNLKDGAVGSSSPASVISKRGWKIIGIGLLTVAAGFVVLSFTDPSGKNFASRLSPFLIIGGYAVIGYGILAKDPPVFPASK